MSIWSKMGRVGVSISLLIYGNVMGMEKDKVEKAEIDDSPAWPTMAIDETPDHLEGEHLAEYHATAHQRGFVFHIPKNADELEDLYEIYQKTGGRCPMCKDMRDVWINILSDIDEELTARCLDGDVYFIDKYLQYLNNFISWTSAHSDTKFTADLYNGGSSDLEDHLFGTVTGIVDLIKKNSQYTFESTHVLKAVLCIDNALTKAGKNMMDFSTFFHQLYVDKTYQQSSQYQAMMNEFYKLFKDGISINLNDKE